MSDSEVKAIYDELARLRAMVLSAPKAEEPTPADRKVSATDMDALLVAFQNRLNDMSVKVAGILKRTESLQVDKLTPPAFSDKFSSGQVPVWDPEKSAFVPGTMMDRRISGDGFLYVNGKSIEARKISFSDVFDSAMPENSCGPITIKGGRVSASAHVAEEEHFSSVSFEPDSDGLIRTSYVLKVPNAFVSEIILSVSSPVVGQSGEPIAVDVLFESSKISYETSATGVIGVIRDVGRIPFITVSAPKVFRGMVGVTVRTLSFVGH